VPEGSDIGDSRLGVSLAEWSVSRYDQAIVSLGFMVGSMNFDWKTRTASTLIAFQQLPNQSRLKSHSVRREQSGFLQTAVMKIIYAAFCSGVSVTV
jgi:hypothetical protein